jgi:proton-translocating NADH-quinone oxidoreductase chain L
MRLEIIGLEPTTLYLQSTYSIQLSYIPSFYNLKKNIMLINTVLLPFLASFFNILFGKFLGVRGVTFLTISSLFSSLCITLYYFYTSVHLITYIKLYNWCFFGNFNITFELLFDQLTYIMLIVVLSISLVVHIYSTQYLKYDPHLVRFLTWLSLFTFFMLILVTAENLIQIFIGWEGVGICSYLLINFWYTRIQANKAALKAIFVNKIGDIFLLFAIILCYSVFGSTSFSIIFTNLPYILETFIVINNYSLNLLNLIGFCFVIGAIGKSAQIGLHIWLPDAMEGPTPVSALLHAATMVTAGVFLIIRLSFFFEYVPVILNFLLIIGATTALFASTVGLTQYDLKRIIAFSTCSQLGYMFVACGSSNYALALFHLFNHAFFKALLFLAAGNIIHALTDEQDIRKMGGLANFLPLTFTFFVIASLALMGFPFLSGFFSKDLLIELTWFNALSSRYIASFFLVFAAFLTAAYSIRLIYYVFLTKPNFSHNKLKNLQDANVITQWPLILLCIFSIFSGYMFQEFFIGVNTDFLNNSILIFNKKQLIIEHEFLNLFVKQLPLIGSIISIVLVYKFLKNSAIYLRFLLSSYFYYLLNFLNHKWFFDKFYNSVETYFLTGIDNVFSVFLDKGMLEFIGPEGFSKYINLGSLTLIRIQSGNISNYLLYIVLCLIVFFFIYIKSF